MEPSSAVGCEFVAPFRFDAHGLEALGHALELVPGLQQRFGILPVQEGEQVVGGESDVVANRTAETGHADDFFSASHALWPAMTEFKKKAKRRTLTVNSNRISLTIGAATAALPKNPLEKLEKVDFPETAKDDGHGFYQWHYDPDLLTILLRHQSHHESAVRCKTDTAALSYRPHVNNKCFEAWLTLKVINNAVQALTKEAREQPDRVTEVVKRIKELQEALEADKEKLGEVREFYRFLPTEVVVAGIYDYNYLGNTFLNLFYGEGEVAYIRHLYARTLYSFPPAGSCTSGCTAPKAPSTAPPPTWAARTPTC
ncbi:MAG: hypothetical protein GY866_25515 [Proteobacteria bacterium]|nr:hypothetical protein [Pseudomonadota bacterium]